MKGPVYGTDYPGDCRTREIDGMTLAFHRPSGTTHFLDSPVPGILALLAERPDDAAGLTRRLCSMLAIAEDAEAVAVVTARLDELLSAGLVRIV